MLGRLVWLGGEKGTGSVVMVAVLDAICQVVPKWGGAYFCWYMRVARV